jgi:hypothetical protein
MNDRLERQRDLVPADRLAELGVTVIGVGSIGHQVALHLAAIGSRHLQLIDFDRIEPANVTCQGFHSADVGQLKVAAARWEIDAIDPTISVDVVDERFRPKQQIGEVVFCCVDTIASRAAIWRAAEHRCRVWLDGRMLGEAIRILTASDHESRAHYASTLFSQSDAQAGQCTSRSTIYAASIAAGIMLHQFSRWLRHLPLDCDTTVNLLAGEWNASLIKPLAEVPHPGTTIREKGEKWEHAQN